jgi:hypothetical protein
MHEAWGVQKYQKLMFFIICFEQELPEQWNNTKKIAITIKQQVAPLQATEVANIRRKTASFDVSQHKFREKFRSIPPFRFECDKPYAHLDKVMFSATLHCCIHNTEILRRVRMKRNHN